MKKIILYIMAVIVSGTITACSSNDETKTPQILPVYDMSGFVKGADVSWLTAVCAYGLTPPTIGTVRKMCW